MDYLIHELADMAGVSVRTLRHYDRLGLLKPARTAENGYRIYGENEVDRLQEILFYRALGMPLERICGLLDEKGRDRLEALKAHRAALSGERARLDTLLMTLERTIRAKEGEENMKDPEKFEGFKREKIAENEKRYGREARARYGDAAVDGANDKLLQQDASAWNAQEALAARILTALKAAMETGDPSGKEAQAVCALHEQWIRGAWKDGAYSRAAHRGLAELYTQDARFTAYYDDACGAGAAQFLHDALLVYTA